MAMPSGNMVVPEKMQFPNAAGAGGGGEMLYRQQQWYVDDRDGFISWLRSEFAAANAIIDAMCHHLRAVGEPGEYDVVVGAVQQRRCNWNQVLLMQQYFSVSEVVYALQQVAWRKQQLQQQQQQNRHHVVADPVKAGGSGGTREFRKFRQGGQRFEVAANKEGYNLNANAVEKGTNGTEKNEEVVKSGGKVGAMSDSNGLDSAEEDKKDAATKHQSNGILNSSGNSQGSMSNSESEATGVNDGCISNTTGNDSHPTQDQHQIQNPSALGKTFIGNEMFDGKTVNVVDGLKLYEELFDCNEVSKLVSLISDLRVTGKRGQFQGTQTYVVSKRPMRGHGREVIQLGVPILDAPSDVDHVTGSSKDKNVESMPSLLQDIIERLAASQVMTVKPDACIVDFYNEGDHSQPYNWPPWYGRPICMLSLTECDMTFGRVIVPAQPGDFRGTLKLSLVPGSFLVMEGKSTDFAKYAIQSIRKQRILVTFTKSQPKKSLSMDAQRLSLPATSYRAPPPSRSPNHIRHQVGHKHYATVTTTGVLPAPSMRPQIPPPPNGMQPLFVPAPVVPPMSFTAPVPIPPGSTGWTATPSRHPPTRLPVPGTGVFLPPPGSVVLMAESQASVEVEPILGGSVQELFLNNLSENLPANYIYEEGGAGFRDALLLSEDDDIPVVDLHRITSPSTAEQELEKLQHALNSWGCFQAINHGMSSAFLDKVRGISQQFFQLPKEEKLKYAREPNDIEGYGNDTIFSKNQRLDWTDRVYLKVQPEDKRKFKLWPEKPNDFRTTVLEYTERLRVLNEVILKAMAKSLNLEEDCFLNECGERCEMLLRFNYYPPCPMADHVLGVKPHADGSTITFLLQDKEVEGLQFLKDNRWFKVPIIDDALVINVGDQIEILSNGFFRSPVHRAVVNEEKERLTIAMFFTPGPEKEIKPVAKLVNETRPELYGPVKDYPGIFFQYYQQGKRPIEASKINF